MPATGDERLLAVADDEPYIRDLIRDVAESAGWQVVEMRNGAELHRALDRGLLPDVIFMDVIMPEEDGVELAKSIKTRNLDCVVQVMTGGPMLYAGLIGKLLDGTGVRMREPLAKPFSMKAVKAVLEDAAASLEPAALAP